MIPLRLTSISYEGDFEDITIAHQISKVIITGIKSVIIIRLRI